jgi:cell division protein FtsB
MTRQKLVFQMDSPRRTLAIRATMMIVALMTAYLVYDFGRNRGGFSSIEAATEQTSLNATIRDLEKRNTELRRQTELLRTGREIDSEAYRQVEQQLAKLQTQIAELQKDLEFYRSIVSPADDASGLRIQAFEVEASTESEIYRLKLVLIQAKNHQRRISGDVSLRVDGAIDGEPVSYGLADLSPDSSDSGSSDKISFSFRYFQDFERSIILPDGFVPDRIFVEVRPSRRSARTISQTFDWDTGTG